MKGLSRYLTRGFIFLIVCLACSLFIFWFTDPHNPAPFMRVVEFGIPAWFTVNAVERWAIDRVKAQNGCGGED